MRKTSLLMTALALIFAGCASTPAPSTSSRPAWIDKGGYPGDPVTVIYGVGVANAMPNIALQREASESRARGNVASSMNTYVAKLVKDYMDHHVDYFDQENTAGSDEFVSSVSKSVTEAQLVGSRIVDHWTDPATGAMYSLARIDTANTFDEYKEKLKKAIRDNHGKALKARTDDALKDLDKELGKQREREKEILESVK